MPLPLVLPWAEGRNLHPKAMTQKSMDYCVDLWHLVCSDIFLISTYRKPSIVIWFNKFEQASADQANSWRFGIDFGVGFCFEDTTQKLTGG